MGSLVIALLAGLCVPSFAQAKKDEQKTQKAETSVVPPCQPDEDAIYHDLEGVLRYDQDFGGADDTISAIYEMKLARSYEKTENEPAHRTYVFMVQGAWDEDPDMPNNGDTSDLVSSLYGVDLAKTVSLYVYPKKGLTEQQLDNLLILGEVNRKYRVIDGNTELAVLVLPKQRSEKTDVGNFSGEFFPTTKKCGSEWYLKLVEKPVLK